MNPSRGLRSEKKVWGVGIWLVHSERVALQSTRSAMRGTDDQVRQDCIARRVTRFIRLETDEDGYGF